MSFYGAKFGGRLFRQQKLTHTCWQVTDPLHPQKRTWAVDTEVEEYRLLVFNGNDSL